MNDRKLTIGMPVCERYKYFEEALMSAVNQVVPVKIIVIDNASSHDKFEVFVNSLNLENVTYVRNEVNLGLFANWNRCAELCQTEFVTILCDDDIIDKEYSSIFFKKLLEYPNIDCFHTKSDRFGRSYAENTTSKKRTIIGYHSGIELLKQAAKNGLSSIEPNTIAFKASMIKKVKYNEISGSYNSDYLFTYTAFLDSFLYGEDKSLLKLRMHDSNAGSTSGNLPYLSCSYVFNQIKLELKALNLKEWKEAEIKEKNVLRNAIVRDINVKEDIVKIMSNPNHIFGIQIKSLLENDFLSRLAIDNNGLVNKIIVFYFRVIRKIQNL